MEIFGEIAYFAYDFKYIIKRYKTQRPYKHDLNATIGYYSNILIERNKNNDLIHTQFRR